LTYGESKGSGILLASSSSLSSCLNRSSCSKSALVRNARGYACVRRGELGQARVHYQEVLQMNPTDHPAKQAIEKINDLEQQQNELFTPQGRTLHKEKTWKTIHDVVDTLKLVRDIVTLGR
jgi:hypothetical protein